MAGFNDAPLIQSIAVPAVCLLILFLGYFSQFLFHTSNLDPGQPSSRETYTFNTLLLLLWFTYYRAVTVDPGRYVFKDKVIEAEGKWCNKCNAPKPLRSHHCRHCARCVPRMDHHCPWTRNCVSLTTFPHFLRFLVYTNLALWYLGGLTWQRFYALWESRLMPAYLGPSLGALIGLACMGLVWFVTTIALGIMLATTIKNWVFNKTMIEGWELDRHEAILDRGGRDWWDITGPDGNKIRFERIEFPYDIGFFSNMAQAMGTSNILLWFFPFAGNPRVSSDGKGIGWEWEENGFNRDTGLWPPVDPDKIRRANRSWPAAKRDYATELREAEMSPQQQKQAFQQRQEADLRRRRRDLVAELEEVEVSDSVTDNDEGIDDEQYQQTGDEWRNSDGDRLADYGVDEEAENNMNLSTCEDDVPLAEVMRRRKASQQASAQMDDDR